jgi:hypothetical protein
MGTGLIYAETFTLCRLTGAMVEYNVPVADKPYRAPDCAKSPREKSTRAFILFEKNVCDIPPL